MSTKDVCIYDHQGPASTLIGLQPVSAAALNWFEINVSSENWQWVGSVLYVDHRLAYDLMEGLAVHGFQLDYVR